MTDNSESHLEATAGQERILGLVERTERTQENRSGRVAALRRKIAKAEAEIETEERNRVKSAKDIEELTEQWETLEQAKTQLERPREDWDDLTDDEYEEVCRALRWRIACALKIVDSPRGFDLYRKKKVE